MFKHRANLLDSYARKPLHELRNLRAILGIPANTAATMKWVSARGALKGATKPAKIIQSLLNESMIPFTAVNTATQ